MSEPRGDLVLVDEVAHELVETDGDWLELTPGLLGLPQGFVATLGWGACRCTYRVDRELLLDEVAVAWSDAFAFEGGPRLFGRRARRRADPIAAWAAYEELAQPVPFTGALLVGRDREPGPWPSAFACGRVLELGFTRGRLDARADVTAELRGYRADLDAHPLPAPPSGHERERTIAWFEAARRHQREGATCFGRRRAGRR